MVVLFCIFQLREVFSSKTNLNLVLEYLNCDLEMIIKDKAIVFMPSDIKSWMLMLLKGVQECHSHWIIHRVKLSVFLLFIDKKGFETK